MMLHGVDDDIIPLAVAQDSLAWLEKMGQSPHFKTYEMGHSVCPEEVMDMSAWFNKVLV